MWLGLWREFGLQEANGANVHTEFLIGTPHVIGREVHDREPHRLACPVFEDRSAPLAGVFLQEEQTEVSDRSEAAS